MVYESFHYNVQPDGLHITFCFRLNEQVAFHPSAIIEIRDFLNFNADHSVLDTLVFNIGMVELISYWKCACPPLVSVECGSLDDSQIQFWKKLYYNGLGEFFWMNGISATQDDFMTIVSDGPKIEPCENNLLKMNTTAYLVPIGGGKDSVVTLEALKDKKDVRPLIMNPRGATTLCAERGGFQMDQVLVIQRSLDPLLLELNSQGMLNGHTPFSAMLGFYTLLASALSGYANIALSNESSANESTVVGTAVNHQYSKSLEFENDFRDYTCKYVGNQFRYLSFLRPFSELQIAMLFARQEKYFDVFKSCNVGSKQDIWCGHCAKCLFAFIILSPFIAPERLERIFGKNMLDDNALRFEFDQLLGQAETKPFECVGTISEVHSALSMAITKYYQPAVAQGKRKELPALLVGYNVALPTTPLHTLFPDNNLSPEELTLLTNFMNK